MSTVHGPGYSALSRGRYSAAGEQYFLTFNLENRQHGLNRVDILPAIGAECQRLERASAWHVRTGVVMPDHVHLLVRLADSASLGSVVRQLKGRLAPVLRPHGLRWQRSFYDHRIRHGEDVLPVFLYVFLNPHRAGLVQVGEKWSGYSCAADDWEWFEPLTSSGAPYPEWLDERER